MMKIRGCRCTRKVGENVNNQDITWLVSIAMVAMNWVA